MGATQNPNGERAAVDWNDVFEALAAAPRRRLLASLLHADRDEAVRLPAAAMAPDAGGDPATMRVELYHNHLPTLAASGFVEWETDPLVAVRGPDFPAVAAVVEAIESEAVIRPDSLCDDDGGTGGHRVDAGDL